MLDFEFRRGSEWISVFLKVAARAHVVGSANAPLGDDVPIVSMAPVSVARFVEPASRVRESADGAEGSQYLHVLRKMRGWWRPRLTVTTVALRRKRLRHITKITELLPRLPACGDNLMAEDPRRRHADRLICLQGLGAVSVRRASGFMHVLFLSLPSVEE